MILPPLWIVMLHPGAKELTGALLLLREKGHLFILPNENLEEEEEAITLSLSIIIIIIFD